MADKHTKWAWQDFGSGAILVEDFGRRYVVLAANPSRDTRRPELVTRNSEGWLVPLDPESHVAKLLKEAANMFEAMQLTLRESRDFGITDDSPGMNDMREIVARINEPAERDPSRAGIEKE